MKLKSLGLSSVQVPVVGQGTMGVGGYYQRDVTHDAAWVQLLRRGIDRGLTFLDTAEIYGAGHSEELIGQAIAGQRERVIVATKFSNDHSRYDQVIRAAEGSLKRLRTDYIDLYQNHWSNPQVPWEETLSAMEQLRRDGKVRFLGLSNCTLSEARQALAYVSPSALVAIQQEYNPLERTAEQQLLPFCEQAQLTCIAYSPLGQGKFAVPGNEQHPLRALIQKYRCTLAQLVMAWLIHSAPVVVIPKSGRIAHLEENAQAGDLVLEPEDAVRIGEIMRPPVVEIPTASLGIAADPHRPSYFTLEEALANPLNLVPSPRELAQQLTGGDILKPVKVKRHPHPTDQTSFLVVDGKIRYWAWRIAFGNQKPIPVLVQE